MVFRLQFGAFDQEIIHKQLPSYGNIDYGRRIFQIRYMGGITRLPGEIFRQKDIVVQFFHMNFLSFSCVISVFIIPHPGCAVKQFSFFCTPLPIDKTSKS